jgi:TatD DNase family protein
MKMIDIGVNLSNKRLYSDAEDIINRAQQAGVEKLIVTGTSLRHSLIAIELCDRFPVQLFSTCGIHPHDAKDWNSQTLSELSELVLQDCVRAVGETGLDFNRNFSPKQQQISVFQQQLELAIDCNKPVFLHQRDAFDTFHSILREYRDRLPAVVVHCFTDNKKALFSLLDQDCHIGVTGWICDERRGQELQQLVKNIPSTRLMLETDAPYLLPRDLSPKPASNLNLPEYLPHILQAVARHQNKAAEQLAEEVFLTTQQFFSL